MQSARTGKRFQPAKVLSPSISRTVNRGCSGLVWLWLACPALAQLDNPLRIDQWELVPRPAPRPAVLIEGNRAAQGRPIREFRLTAQVRSQAERVRLEITIRLSSGAGSTEQVIQAIRDRANKRIDELQSQYALSQQQRQKLELAVASDLRGLARALAVWEERHCTNQRRLRANQFRLASQELQEIEQRANAVLEDGDSLLWKVFRTTATPEQLRSYSSEVFQTSLQSLLWRIQAAGHLNQEQMDFVGQLLKEAIGDQEAASVVRVAEVFLELDDELLNEKLDWRQVALADRACRGLLGELPARP